MAQCPAHEDRTASLSVGTGADGRILLRCFAECSVYEITSALGLEMTDLFPPKQRVYGASSKVQHHPSDLLRVIDQEAKVVLVAAWTLANGYGLTPDDYKRLEMAEERISEVRRYA